MLTPIFTPLENRSFLTGFTFVFLFLIIFGIDKLRKEKFNA
jgi:hypothetical protein